MADAAPPGLIASVRALAADALALAVTRGQLAALELDEARARLLRWAALGLLAGVLLLAALTALTVWVAALTWDGPRGLALGLLTLVYAAGAAIAIVLVRGEVAGSPPLLELTRAELAKDRAALRPTSAEPVDRSGGP